MPEIRDDKYIVFKREDFERLVRDTAHSEAIGQVTLDRGNIIALDDAVVIRRQDLFAAPALHNYANSIAIAISLLPNDELARKRLQAVADYFHQQGEAASEESYKLPD